MHSHPGVTAATAQPANKPSDPSAAVIAATTRNIRAHIPIPLFPPSRRPQNTAGQQTAAPPGTLAPTGTRTAPDGGKNYTHQTTSTTRASQGSPDRRCDPKAIARRLIPGQAGVNGRP